MDGDLLVWPLCSGSSGNCLLVGWAGSHVLVDAGWSSQKAFLAALDEVGLEPGDIGGILVTHTHADHVNYTTYRAAERYGIPLYMHSRNWERAYKLYWHGRLLGSPAWKGQRGLFRYHDPFSLGPFRVEAAEVAHDGGACCAFRLSTPGPTLAVATDLGSWDERLARFLSAADVLVVESNWDHEMLEQSTRAPADVARVRGGRGHLSNRDCARLVLASSALRPAPPAHVVLAHVSDDHNAPDVALGTVRSLLAEGGLDVPVTLAPRGAVGEPVRVRSRR